MQPTVTLSVRFEKGTRFYHISVQEDLFGDWVVVRVNGRINSPMGQIHTLAFKSKAKADEFYQDECLRRKKRGYVEAKNFTNRVPLVKEGMAD